MKWTYAIPVWLCLIFCFGLATQADMISPGPAPPKDAVEQRRLQKQKESLPAYPVAAAVIVFTTSGSLAALYFIRKRNGN